MISWIQNHLIRHGRWIFLTLLAIVIIAFVFTIGNTPGCTTNQSVYEKQLFYGYDLNSSHEMETLGEKVALSALLNTGRPIQNQQQFQSQLTSRIALLHLADEMGIPALSENSLASYIQSKAAFRGPNGQFSRDAYIRFIDNIESNPRIREDLIVVVLKEDYRIKQVREVLSGPGYFLPSEALYQVQLDETTLQITTAEINYSEFNPQITPNTDELTQFYENNISRYEVPERIQAGYIRFPTKKYIDQLGTFSEEALREHFNANRARFVAAYQAKQPSETETAESEKPSSPTVNFEDVRDEVVADLTVQNVQKLANKAAQNFALTLYRNNIQLNTPEFQELLDKNKLELLNIPPYTAEEASNNQLPAKLLESAFTLNERRYFSDAYKIADGFGILIFSGRLPPEIPAYETVADAVKADYSAEEKRRLFNEKGKSLKNELSSLMDSEIVFSTAAEALGLNVTTNEAFKVSEAPRTINQAGLQRAQNMKEGEPSPMITSGDSGIFIYVDEKTVPEIEPEDEKLNQTSTFLQRYATFISSNSLSNELIAKGLDLEEEDGEK